MRLIEFLPLSIFVLYIRYIDINTAQDWNLPFLISGIAALLAIILFVAIKIKFNRLFLGVNLYLISGATAIITQQFWLNRIYGELQASGMLAWVVIVGLVSSLFSPQGFLGVDSNDTHAIKKFSLFLFLTSICAFSLSFAFRGNSVLSEVVPFILIFFAQQTFRKKFTTIDDKDIQT